MSNPISTLPTSRSASPSEQPEVRGSEIESKDTRSDDAETGSAPEQSVQNAEQPRSSWGLLALVLAALLVGSVAVNLKQSRDVAAIASQSAEFEQALGAAIERLDVETSRANGAEAALGRVDTAVDLVNERVLGLQEALDGLREATVR